MTTIEALRHQMRYNNWANRTCGEHLAALGQAPARAIEVLAHIVGAEELWIGRLQRDETPAVVWPQLTLDACRQRLAALDTTWSDRLDDMDQLDAPVPYVNSLGEPWASTAADMVQHVILHSAYHRGQVNTLIGQAGHPPAYTDYIHAVRQNLLG